MKRNSLNRRFDIKNCEADREYFIQCLAFALSIIIGYVSLWFAVDPVNRWLLKEQLFPMDGVIGELGRVSAVATFSYYCFWLVYRLFRIARVWNWKRHRHQSFELAIN